MSESKLGNIDMLMNDNGKSQTESHIVEELIKVGTHEVVLNESTSQLVRSEEMNQMVENN